jgi:hypothetical protein
VDAVPTRGEGFYWVVLGQNPPEVAYWERGEWWLAGDAKPWQPEAVTVISDRLILDHEQHCGNSRHQTESVLTCGATSSQSTY